MKREGISWLDSLQKVSLWWSTLWSLCLSLQPAVVESAAAVAELLLQQWPPQISLSPWQVFWWSTPLWLVKNPRLGMSHSAAPLSAGLTCLWTVLRHHQLLSPYGLRDDAKMNKKIRLQLHLKTDLCPCWHTCSFPFYLNLCLIEDMELQLGKRILFVLKKLGSVNFTESLIIMAQESYTENRTYPFHFSPKILYIYIYIYIYIYPAVGWSWSIREAR